MGRTSKSLNMIIQYGFIGNYSDDVASLLCRYPILRQRISTFKTGIAHTGHRVKSTSWEIFGIPPTAFYYDNARSGLLIQHLTRLFLIKNPNPTQAVKFSFTLILHQHSLPSPISERL